MKGKFRKNSGGSASLTLTPLLDMFTIILIFLIVSFESEDHGFEPNDEIDLPKSSARSVFKPAVNVALTHDELLVEKQNVMTLQDGQFKQEYYDRERIDPLVEKLQLYYKKIKGEDTGGKAPGDPKTDKAIMLVQADKKLDYKTLYLVLRSGALAGFVKYRLVILKK